MALKKEEVERAARWWAEQLQGSFTDVQRAAFAQALIDTLPGASTFWELWFDAHRGAAPHLRAALEICGIHDAPFRFGAKSRLLPGQLIVQRSDYACCEFLIQ